jgi:hypothetical protein
MSEHTQQTDWTAMAEQAMEQQDQRESAALATESVEAGPRITPTALVAMAAKLLLLVAVGCLLVDCYGIVTLVLLALVGWFIVRPWLTPWQQNGLK